jgi:hypothetical protein
MTRHIMQDTQYHRPGDPIYHIVDADCPDGMKIPKDDREQGPGRASSPALSARAG